MIEDIRAATAKDLFNMLENRTNLRIYEENQGAQLQKPPILDTACETLHSILKKKAFMISQTSENDGSFFLDSVFLENDMYQYISGLYISDSCRRKGLGSDVLSFAESKGRSKKTEGLVLIAQSRNFTARNFYEKKGFLEFKPSNPSDVSGLKRVITYRRLFE
jgi:ribosomal protein S18 acetylase RimI-like enzyme